MFATSCTKSNTLSLFYANPYIAITKDQINTPLSCATMADEANVKDSTTPTSDEPDLGKKAFDHFDKQNQNAVTGGVAAAATDSSLVTQWMMQSIFSAINLGSHLSAINQRPCIPSDLGCRDYVKTTPDKWTTSVESISLALALLMTIGHYCCVKYTTKYVMGK